MQNKREKFMNNVLELSINSGKINKNANYILYSENSNEEKRKVIKQTEEDLIQIIENVINIADSLELPIEEIYSRINTNK